MNLVSMPISQLATVQSGGGAPQDSAAFTRTGSPFVRAGSLPKLLNGAEEDSLELIESEVAAEYGLKLFPAGTVLFAKSGMSATKGHVYRLRSPAYVVNHLAALVPHEPSDSEFLAHALQRYPPTILIKDPAYPSIRLGDIESLRIQAPTSPRNRERIAGILDKADALRAKRRAALAQLDTLTQCIFLDMFGDPATILHRWPVSKLGQHLKFLTSGSRGWAKHYAEQGDLFLRIQNVRRDELSLDDIAYVRAPSTAEARRTRVEAGDVLLSITADLGRTAVVPNGLGDAFINQHLAILRTNVLVPRFLSAFLASPAGRSQVLRQNRQAVKAGLNFDDIRGFVVPFPPVTIQRRFEVTATAVGASQRAQDQALTRLDSLFASLQYRAFRGEL